MHFALYSHLTDIADCKYGTRRFTKSSKHTTQVYISHFFRDKSCSLWIELIVSETFQLKSTCESDVPERNMHKEPGRTTKCEGIVIIQARVNGHNDRSWEIKVIHTRECVNDSMWAGSPEEQYETHSVTTAQ